jgi:YggT family protein
MNALFDLLAAVVEIFVLLLIVYALLSWFPAPPGSAVRRLQAVLGAVCEPVLRPVRRLIPPIRTGGGAIDLSVLIVIVVAQVVVVPVLKAG